MIKNFVTRRRHGKAFSYYAGDELIADKKQIKYFKSLKIPPAWEEVKITVNTRARVLATGFDKAGRLQYIYHPKFRAKQEQAKFERTLRFAHALPRMRRVTEEHLAHKKFDKEKILACIVRLMDQAYFRVGNEVYARTNQSYGLTTIRSKHVSFDGDTITFDYTGKSGQHQRKHITDRTLKRIIKKLDDLPGYEVFKYYDTDGQLQNVTSADVNSYIKEIMGEEFSAKDFRTWGGTLLAGAELAHVATAETKKDRMKAVTKTVKKVARKLGNTPAIAKASYIDPRIIKTFIESDDLNQLRKTVKNIAHNDQLNPDEQRVLSLLEKP